MLELYPNSRQGQGAVGDGISGTARRAGKMLALQTMWREMQQPYEFIDAGAFDGVMVLCSLAFGAKLAYGFEHQNSSALSEQFIKHQTKLQAEQGLASSRSRLDMGWSVGKFKSMPSLQMKGETPLPKGVYAFCQGWNPTDRAHLLRLVGEDPLVQVFVCCKCPDLVADYRSGRSPVNFSCYDHVLHDLNDFTSKVRLPAFRHVETITIAMSGSRGHQKHLFVLKRD